MTTPTRASRSAPGAVPFDLAPGCRVGRYAVLGRLDEGGEALLYRVLHVELGKPFVLKLARRRIDRASIAGTGLAAQGRLLAELDHPGLVPVVDLDIHEGRPFLVMDYVPGLNLAQYAAQRPQTPRQAAAIVADVARVVAFLHGRGIIHQDIKPKNLLIDESGRPRVIDFGQARLRHAWSEPRAEASGGTLAYMSPEQAEGDGERITTRTDVFGLGAVLYELLCGRPPYQAPTLTALGELAPGPRDPVPGRSTAASPAGSRRSACAPWPATRRTATPAPTSWSGPSAATFAARSSSRRPSPWPRPCWSRRPWSLRRGCRPIPPRPVPPRRSRPMDGPDACSIARRSHREGPSLNSRTDSAGPTSRPRARKRAGWDRRWPAGSRSRPGSPIPRLAPRGVPWAGS